MRARPRFLLAVLLASLSFAVYVPSLSGEWLLDDTHYLVENPAHAPGADWTRCLYDPSALTAHPGQARMMFRPLTALSFDAVHRLGRASPYWHHLFSSLNHAANVILVFLLLLRLADDGRGAEGRRLAGAALGALLFALHPAQVESVSYISGSRATLLSAFFCLSSMLCYDASARRIPWARLASAALFAAALLSKESSAFLLLVLPAYDLVYLRVRTAWLERAEAWTPYAAETLLFFALRRIVLGAWAQRGFWGGGLLAHAASSTHGLFQDVRIALWPTGLRVCYGLPGGAALYTGALWKGAALLLLLAAALWALRRRRRAGFALCWSAAALVPVSNLLPLEALAADRFLYLPLFGLALLAALPLCRLPVRRSLAALPLILVLGFGSLRQQGAWRDGYSLDLCAYEAAPDDPCTGLNLSAHFYNWNMLGRAEELAAPALSDGAPRHLKLAALERMAMIRIKQGRDREAVPYIEQGLELHPGDHELSRLRELAEGRFAVRGGGPHPHPAVQGAYGTRLEGGT